MKTYRDLDVWREGMNLAEDVCRITGNFPRAEQFGLTAQLRRSVMSVPANIAEGNGRLHPKALTAKSAKDAKEELLCRF